MKMFRVLVRRIVNYSGEVVVGADSPEEAAKVAIDNIQGHHMTEDGDEWEVDEENDVEPIEEAK